MKNYTNISQQKVFWNNQTFSSLSRNIKLVMAIVIVLAIVTILAIKTIIDIKTNIPLSEIEPDIKCKKLIPRWLF